MESGHRLTSADQSELDALEQLIAKASAERLEHWIAQAGPEAPDAT